MWQTSLIYKPDETKYYSLFKEQINNVIFHHILLSKLLEIKVKGPE